jgi:hypothetical protein
MKTTAETGEVLGVLRGDSAGIGSPKVYSLLFTAGFQFHRNGLRWTLLLSRIHPPSGQPIDEYSTRTRREGG